MSFQPVVPFGGYAGWLFLQRTREDQQQALSTSPAQQRDTIYFLENAAKIRTADDLVGDRRLLSVALGAFGLSEDIDNRAFIREVLAGGTLDPDALANKLSDKRYFALSRAFGFDLGVPNTQLSDFAAGIVAQYRTRAFEASVGAQDQNMRLALGFQRDLATILDKDTSNDGRWFAVMGTPPLRRVFETALGFPSGFAGVDIDRQLEAFKDRSQRVFGTSDLSDFSDPELQEKALRLFLVRAELGSGGPAVTSPALQILLAGA